MYLASEITEVVHVCRIRIEESIPKWFNIVLERQTKCTHETEWWIVTGASKHLFNSLHFFLLKIVNLFGSKKNIFNLNLDRVDIRYGTIIVNVKKARKTLNRSHGKCHLS